MTMKLDLKVADELHIGDDIKIRLEKKSGQVARVSITAPRDCPLKLIGHGQSMSWPTRQT